MKVKDFIDNFLRNTYKARVCIYPSTIINGRDISIEVYNEYPDQCLLAEFNVMNFDPKNLKELNKSISKRKIRLSKKHFFDTIGLVEDCDYTAEQLLDSEIERIACSYVGHGGGQGNICIFVKDFHLKMI